MPFGFHVKILLRKMRSSALGGAYSKSFFSTAGVTGRGFALSVTVNADGERYHDIMKKYGIQRDSIWELDSLCRNLNSQDYYDEVGGVRRFYRKYQRRRVGVYWIRDDILILGTKPTYDGDKPKYSNYAKTIVERCCWVGCLHFTHFGFLKTAFPRSLIIKILNEFLAVYDRQEMKSLKICWDIDEKFADEMAQLLAEKYSEFNISDDVVMMSEEKFTW